MKIDDAIYHAFQAHHGVRDKAGEPYIKHPLRVMRRIIDSSMDGGWHGVELDDLCVVAVLHDVWEDTDYVLSHLNEVQYDALAAITRHWVENEGETYKEYIARCCQNKVARIVKYTDLQDNLSPQRMSYLDIGEAKSMTKRYQWSLDYIEGL